MDDDQPESDADLAYGGVCPVCGEEFEDDFEDVEAGEPIEGVRLCVVEMDGEAEIGECLLHLPDDQENTA